MRNVARGVGLGGLATLFLACAMAAPSVAHEINISPIHVEVHSPTVGHPTTPSFKTVIPPNSKSNLGRPSSVDVFNSQKGGTTTGGGGAANLKELNFSSPRHSDPSLRFTFAKGAGVHREQLDDDLPDYPTPGGDVWNMSAAATGGKYGGEGGANNDVAGQIAAYFKNLPPMASCAPCGGDDDE